MDQYVPYATLIQLRPNDCPKYASCNANICSLDPECCNRIYRKGETVCFYMLEAQKKGAKQRFRGTIEGEIYQAISITIEDLKCRYRPLRNRLERAIRTGSRMGVST